MYCTYCGEQIEDNSKFCQHCGRQLTPSKSTSVSLTFPGLGRRSSAVGSLAVLILFFLPWVFVSCSLSDQALISANAYEIATGNYSDLNELQEFGNTLGATDSSSNEDAYPAVFLLLIFGLVGFASVRGDTLGNLIAFAAGVLGLIGMIVFTLKANDIRSELIQGGMTMSFRIGYWGTWLAFLWMAATGFVGGRKNGP